MKLGTVQRKRRKEFYPNSGCFATENRFSGQAVSGALSVKEYSHHDDTCLDLDVHLSEEAVVEAGEIKTEDSGFERRFVFVDLAAYHTDSDVLRNPEATLYMSVEQARALRDSLKALDI